MTATGTLLDHMCRHVCFVTDDAYSTKYGHWPRLYAGFTVTPHTVVLMAQSRAEADIPLLLSGTPLLADSPNGSGVAEVVSQGK